MLWYVNYTSIKLFLRNSTKARQAEPSKVPHGRLDGGYGLPPPGRISGNERGRGRGAAQSPGGPRGHPQPTPPGPTAVAGAGRKARRQGLWQRPVPSRPLDPSYPADS